MEQKIFQNVDVRQREQYLRDNATAVEKKTFVRHLTPEEVIKLHAEFSQKAVDLSNAEEELQIHRENFKSTAKPIKSEMGQLMKSIRSSSEELTEDVFLLADMEEQMMGYYNKLGELVYSRPLLAQERQFSIIDNSLKKAK